LLGKPRGAYAQADDWYICDLLGSYNNDFLDDVEVVTLVGEADSVVALTPSTGVDNYALVDGAGGSGRDDTEYVYSAVSTTSDMYTCQDLPATVNDVKGVMIGGLGQKDSGGNDMKLKCKVGATTDISGALTLPTDGSHQTVGFVLDEKPGTGDWAASDVNGMEIGAEVA
jgi:hypothetical protein